MGKAVVEHVVVIVVIAKRLVGDLTAYGLWVVTCVPVQRTALVRGLEKFCHHTSYILSALSAVLVFHAPQTVPTIALAHAGTVLEDIVVIHLHLMLLIDVPTQLHGHQSEVVTVDPVFQRLVVVVVVIAQRQHHVPHRLQISGFFLRGIILLVIVCATKLRHMLDTSCHKQPLRGVGAEIQMFLVVIGACSIHDVHLAGLLVSVLTVIAVHHLTIAEVEVYL